MDGLSVIASVTGILTAAAKVIMMVTKFIEKERGAPHLMPKVLAEVADLSNCLTQLSPFIQNIENVPRERKAAISVEQIVAINTSCVLTLSELEKVLDSFQFDQPMAAVARLRWARHQEKIENILVRVRASKSSLNLILTIFTCTSVSEIQSSISNLNTTVQSILANSEDIPRRIASIETKIAGLSRHATSTIEIPTDTSDGASTIRPTGYVIENDHSPPPDDGHIMTQFCIEIQTELEASRVYRRTAKRHSISSFPSGLHSAAWSALSGVSLAEISGLSVLSLPISYDELWNPQHYTSAREPHDPAESSDTSALYPLNTQGVGMGMAREGLSDAWTVGVDVNRINSPLLYDNSSPEISGARDSASKFIAVGSASSSPIMPSEIPLQTIYIPNSMVKWRSHVSIILLGNRFSGKSTVFKQMKLRWSGSVCDVEERKQMGQVILVKMITVFNTVMREMHHEEMKYQREDSLQHAKLLQVAADTGFEQITLPTCLFALERLWADETVKNAFRLLYQTRLYDNLDYDIGNIDRYLSEAYTPSDDDILHCSIPTFETIEMFSRIDGLEYRVFDTGSGLEEREKAVHRFAMASGSHCMIFTVPLCCYDRCSVFENSADMIREDLTQFFIPLRGARATVILLFTHLDLLEEDIRRNLFKDDFPDYTGRQDDVIAAREFIAHKFRGLRNGMTIFFTKATDTKEFPAVLSRIEDLMKAQWR
ncbi:hypothetical protein JMJ35_001828 [Cladonia borealis]|uniref:G-protein alpha subunit-domain-containing protein n=1 Tax=Cladonia borealis TaxID=184061 RepID=A0AA39R8S4_9LECA|nr:hypothetical protein JMJ35_001828 [Cladonia borealis]